MTIPETATLLLPHVGLGTIFLNGNQINDPLDGNLGYLSTGDLLSMDFPITVYETHDSTRTPIPFSSSPFTFNDRIYTVENIVVPSSPLEIIDSSTDISLRGTIYDEKFTSWQFLIRSILHEDYMGVRNTSVEERYFYFKGKSTVGFCFDPTWLSGQMVKEIDNGSDSQSVYYLGSWPRGSQISIPIGILNPWDEELSITAMGLPRGLTINQSINGTISVANKPGIYSLVIRVEDSLGNTGSPSTLLYTFAIEVLDSLDTHVSTNDSVIWDTPSGDLGSSYSTLPSHFSFSAHNPLGQTVSYSISPSSEGLPSGLSLSQGMIVGILPFVQVATTYRIVVRASVNAVFSERVFTFTILPCHTSPSYLDVYHKITESNREILTSWNFNLSSIPDQYIYRPLDPHYGRSLEPLMSIALGLTLDSNSVGYFYLDGDSPLNGTYSSTYGPNYHSVFRDKLIGYHRPILLKFHDIDFTPTYSPDGEYLYDTLYVEIKDDFENRYAWDSQGNESLYHNTKPTRIGTMSPMSNNSWVDLDSPHSWFGQDPSSSRLYPACLKNCRMDLITTKNRQSETFYRRAGATPGIGLSGREGLPLFQSESKTGKPTGWFPCVVMAYLLPGTGAIVKANLKQNGALDQLLGRSFIMDRYHVSLSNTQWIIWDPDMNPTTTFDDIKVPFYNQTLFDVRTTNTIQTILFPGENP